MLWQWIADEIELHRAAITEERASALNLLGVSRSDFGRLAGLSAIDYEINAAYTYGADEPPHNHVPTGAYTMRWWIEGR